MPGMENGTGFLSSGYRNVWAGYENWTPTAAVKGFEHHLEAQAAGLMHMTGARSGFLYLAGEKAKDRVCGACADKLAQMLPGGASLTVIYRDAAGMIQRTPFVGR